MLGRTEPRSPNNILPVPFLRHCTQIHEPKPGLARTHELRQYEYVIRNLARIGGDKKMSHAYDNIFAKVYNKMWGGFALNVAHKILDYYKETEVYKNNKVMLDLCCGTGQLAHEFLKENFEVIGIDISESMLYYAKENAKEYIKNNFYSSRCQ